MGKKWKKRRVPLPHKARGMSAPERKVYRQLWRIVDGAVKDCFLHHMDYLTVKGHHTHAARRSINKRVVGAILGYTTQVKQPRADKARRCETTEVA